MSHKRYRKEAGNYELLHLIKDTVERLIKIHPKYNLTKNLQQQLENQIDER